MAKALFLHLKNHQLTKILHVPESVFPADPSIPTQRPTGLIFNHPRLEKVLFFLQIHQFAHPRKWITGAGIQLVDADYRRGQDFHAVGTL